jgi:tetratricopeptide (TPR) repeat protein
MPCFGARKAFAPGMVRAVPTAAELWAEADAAWKRRDADAALSAADALLALEPGHVDALTLAGLVRTTVRADAPGEWERGIAQLERALALGVEDEKVAVHYGEALARRGRAADAVPPVRAWAAAHPSARAAWNTLGWLLGVEGDDFEAGRAALERALEEAPGSGDARLNLGRLLAKQGRPAEAAAQFVLAVQSKDCPRPQEAWLRLGEAYLALGHLRRALGALRRAQEVDRRGEYTRPLFDGINALTHLLHQQRRFILHVDDEPLRNKAIEAARPVVGPDAPREPLSSLAARARALRGEVREAAHTALEAVEEQAAARALLPRWSEQSVCADLEAHGGEGGRALAAAWRLAQADLYEELLEREEPLVDASSPLAQARALGAARRWGEALAALEANLRGHPETRNPEGVGALAEQWGDRLVRLDEPERAQAFYAVAEEGFSAWAATGGEGVGGEGAARRAAVERVRAKRRG